MRGMQPDDLYELALLGECDLSPDGRRVAFVVTRLDRETDGYRSAIWVVPADGSSEPRQFTAGAKRDTAPRWSPDGRWLAFLSERGEGKPQLFVIPADGGEARPLTDLPFGAGTAAWSPDSKRIAFGARTGAPPDPDPKKAKPYRRITRLKYKYNGEGFVHDRRRHLFVVDLERGEPRQLTDGEWEDAWPAWSPDGSQLAFLSARHEDADLDNLNDVWVMPAAGGEARRLTPTEGSCGGPAWSPDGTRIAFVGQVERPGNGHLQLIAAEGGQPVTVDPAFDRNAGVGPVLFAREAPRWLDNSRLLSCAEDRGEAALIVTAEGEPTRWLARGRRTVAAYSQAVGGHIAFVAGETTAPAELFLLDIASGEEQRLTRFNDGWRGGVALSRPERIAVAVGEGVEVDCWYMKPAGFEEGRQYAVLLSIHGGPFAQYGETFFDEFQVYAGAGYGVVFCNPRGSSGQDTAFAQAIVGDLGGPDYHDVMAAFEAALERMPWADRSRLGVMGGSYGGFMTSWIIGHDHRFKVACSERAANDPYSFQGASDIGGTFYRTYLGENATVQDNTEMLLRCSPLTYARDIETPVLILHAEDDLRCPISQAEQLFAILRMRKKDVEFARFPDENHEMSRSGRPSHRVERFNVILDWFARKL